MNRDGEMSGEKVGATSGAASADLVPVHAAPVGILAALSEPEFEERLRLLRIGQERLARIQRELLLPEIDYGTIPGTPRPSLWQPGAEKLAQFYGLVPVFDREESFGDGKAAPHFRVVVTCRLFRGSERGPLAAEATAAATNWERRYRYRRADRACTACRSLGTIIRSKYGDKGWVCLKTKGGCGAQFPPDAPELKRKLADAENPDPYDTYNTVIRIAHKRAFVAAIKAATASSGLFEQDVPEETSKVTETDETEGTDANEGPLIRGRPKRPKRAADQAEPPDVALLIDQVRRAGALKEFLAAFPVFQRGGATIDDLDKGWAWLKARGAAN